MKRNRRKAPTALAPSDPFRRGLPEGFSAAGAEAFSRAMDAMGLTASDEAGRVVREWFAFFETWPGRRVTGFSDPALAAVKLVADSFAVGRLTGLEPDGEALDLGSGNGWPGLAVPLVLPLSRVTLLDSRAGACEFMRGFVRFAGLDKVSILEARAEAAISDSSLRGVFDTVVTRAMAAPGVALELASTYIRQGGAAILWLGPEQEAGAVAREAVPEVGLALDEVVRYELPGELGRRVVVSYRRVSPAKEGYPRRLSSLKANPLF